MIFFSIGTLMLLPFLHIRKMRKKTQLLLLPSNLYILLEFILQGFFPMLFIPELTNERSFFLAFGIFSVGICFFFVSYHFSNYYFSDGLIRKNEQDLSWKWLDLDNYLQKANTSLLVLGSICIFSTFALTGVIPTIAKHPDARFFFFDPNYFAYYKYFYWFGITILSAVAINSFLFFIKDKQTIRFGICFAICSIVLFLTAHRGPLFGMLIAIYALYYQFHPKRLSLIKFLSHVVAAFLLAMIWLFYREGQGELVTWIVDSLQGGSSFVDFSEFIEALELTASDSYLYGKTYLADLFGFIPYGKWEFRDVWRYKEWTKMLFYVSTEAGGYRLTMFGEPYFNFGFLGVIIQASLAGFGFCLFDNFVVSVSKIYAEKRAFSISRFLFRHTLLFASIYTICNFYNVLFYVAMLIGTVLFLLFSLILREIFQSKSLQTASE